jgi:hypothetical protein
VRTPLFMLAAAILGLAIPGSAAQAQCGGEGKTPCKVWERIPSCDNGLKEDFIKGKCVSAAPAPKPTRPPAAPAPQAGASATRQAPGGYDFEELTKLTDRCEMAHGTGYWNFLPRRGSIADDRTKTCSNAIGGYRCVTLLLNRAQQGQGNRLIMLRDRFATELAQNDCGKVAPYQFAYAELPARGEITESGGTLFRAIENLGRPRRVSVSVRGISCEEMFPGPPVGFFDPIDGGTCWTCPVGWNRTVFPVNGDLACEKGHGPSWPFGERMAATKRGKAEGCPQGGWPEKDPQLPGQEICYACPEGFERFDGFPASPQEIVDKVAYINFGLKSWCSPTAGGRRRAIRRPGE